MDQTKARWAFGYVVVALLLALGLRGERARLAAPSVTAVPVGTQPFDVAVNATTNKIYVANYGDGTVSVVETSATP